MKPDLHLDWDRTKAIAASASNTWGLFVLVLMLGYGLVEVPRNCWNRSQKGFQVSSLTYLPNRAGQDLSAKTRDKTFAGRKSIPKRYIISII